MSFRVAVTLAVAAGYLLGSIPVAVLVARAHGFDPRTVGDRNPGAWNVKEQLGWRGSLPVFAGDTLKGVAAGLTGLALGGIWAGYAAVAAAMIGHAWPVFARFRGGRSILTFAGGLAALSPLTFLLGLGLLGVVAALARSFAVGARTAVFAAPLIQLGLDPFERVLATGALMTLIGLRFGTAWLSGRSAARASSGPGAAPRP
jgi:acyl phosphate:glycerol-3-phosphate acyltransferase